MTFNEIATTAHCSIDPSKWHHMETQDRGVDTEEVERMREEVGAELGVVEEGQL